MKQKLYEGLFFLGLVFTISGVIFFSTVRYTTTSTGNIDPFESVRDYFSVRTKPQVSFIYTPIVPLSAYEQEKMRESLKVNVNHASFQELLELPGIGPVKASAIISYRDSHGTFSDAKDLMNVKGIGEKTFERLESRIRLSDD